MRRAIRASSDKARTLIEHSGNAVNFCGLERLLKGEWREDGGHTLGEHGFARTGRANHKDVVASGACDFDSALGSLLSANVFEIHEELLRLTQECIAIRLDGGDSVAGVHE